MNFKQTHPNQNNIYTKNNKIAQNSLTRHPKSKKKKVQSNNEISARKSKKSVQTSKKVVNDVKAPPSLKRQNTEESPQTFIQNTKLRESQKLLQFCKARNINTKKHKGDFLKIHSDQQSTKAYGNCKQSADEEQDPYKIAKPHKKVYFKQKNLFTNEDNSLTSTHNHQKQTAYRWHHKNYENMTLNQLKESIKHKLKSFKSLQKYQQSENQYFLSKIHLKKEEGNRLNKIHQIEKEKLKEEIFEMKEILQKKIHSNMVS